MVGREAEFTTMRRGLSAASQGACTCRVVSGGHGVGKTRLLQETIDHATAQGFVTVRAVAYPTDANVPYSIVADALSPLVRRMDPGGVRTLSLNPKGTAHINADPWAEVWLEGAKLGDTPLAGIQVPLGTREFVFKHPQYGEKRVTITIRANAPTTIAHDFTKDKD